ncbi:response regulator [Cystobacter fuscus]|uniref:response regulator n=1 Tax=Cystobacter fuscus TaxID=43 RepID=UPI002B2B4693|nr:response regulator [Cystobacter fuscus]
MSTHESKRRILVIDDSEAIHLDFRRILQEEPPRSRDELDQLEEALFGATNPRDTAPDKPMFEVDSAFQGQEGLAKVKEAMAAGRPYEMAFLDYRMPPGWNGAETLRRLRQVAPSLRVVLCSAYSDYSWAQVIQEFGDSHLLRELRKPFNRQAVRHLALSGA